MSVHAADGGLLVRDVFDDVCVHVRLGAVDVVLLRARFRGDARKEAGELVDEPMPVAHLDEGPRVGQVSLEEKCLDLLNKI